MARKEKVDDSSLFVKIVTELLKPGGSSFVYPSYSSSKQGINDLFELYTRSYLDSDYHQSYEPLF